MSIQNTNNPYGLSLSRWSTHGLLLRAVGMGNNVLDLGCNEGYLGKCCHPSNQFSGIEMLPSAAATANKVYRQVIIADLNRMEDIELSETFDVLVFADVLEHLFYPARALAMATSRWLRPNGRVIISLPNVANWQVRLSLLIGRWDYQEVGILDRTHLHFYTFKSGRQLVLDCGLIVEKVWAGASIFGPLAAFPFTRSLLATNIILLARKL